MPQPTLLDDNERSDLPRDIDIPNELPQFDGVPALFMVAGESEMTLYRAERGRMSEIASRPLPAAIGFASFRKEVRALLKGIVRPRDYETFFIFAEPILKRSILKALPTSFTKKVTSVVDESASADDPLALIKKLSAA